MHKLLNYSLAVFLKLAVFSTVLSVKYAKLK